MQEALTYFDDFPLDFPLDIDGVLDMSIHFDVEEERQEDPPRGSILALLRGKDRETKNVLIEMIREAIDDVDEEFIDSLMALASVDELLEYYDGPDAISDDDALRMVTILSQSTGIDRSLVGQLKVNPLALCCLIGDWEEIVDAVTIYRGLVDGGFIDNVDLAQGPDGQVYSLPINDLLFLRDVGLLNI